MIVDYSQVRAVAWALLQAWDEICKGKYLSTPIEQLEANVVAACLNHITSDDVLLDAAAKRLNQGDKS